MSPGLHRFMNHLVKVVVGRIEQKLSSTSATAMARNPCWELDRSLLEAEDGEKQIEFITSQGVSSAVAAYILGHRILE
jgi:hypothetical protein